MYYGGEAKVVMKSAVVVDAGGRTPYKHKDSTEYQVESLKMHSILSNWPRKLKK